MTVLAIDLGTSAIKFLRVDGEGRIIALERIPSRTLDVTTWMHAIRENIAAHDDGKFLTALSITGQMHGLLTLENGGTWGEGIPWHDQRSATLLPAIRSQLGDRAVTTTGGPLAAGFLAASLAWIRVNDPARWSRILQVFLPKDALIHELTGRHVADPSDAVGTGLFDPKKGMWAWDLVSALRIPRPWLPDIIPSGSVAGRLTPLAAESLGLIPGIPIIIAGGDAAVGAFGAGVTHEGDALIMLSSGAQIILPHEEWAPDPRGRWYTWPSVDPGGARYLRVGTLLNAGNTLEWARDILQGGSVDNRPSGLVALPHLIGTREAPSLRAAVVGLTPDTTPGQICRALVEGIAFTIRRKLDEMTATIDRPTRIRIGGGLASRPEIRQLFADVLGDPVDHVGQSDLSVWGAAQIAVGTQAGRQSIPDHDEAIDPDPDHTRHYRTMYRLYCDLDDAMAPFSERLGKISGIH